MTNHNDFRRKIAERTAERLADDSNIKAILMTGSVAMERATEKSDIDLILYHSEPITKEQFRAQKQQAKNAGGGLHHGNEKKGFAVYHVIQNVRVDIGFSYLDRVANAVNHFLEKPDFQDMRTQTTFNGIMNGVPLYGNALIEQWQKKLSSYPVAFQHSMVSYFMKFSPLENTQKTVLDKMLGKVRAQYIFYDRFLAAQRNMLGVLCGLNKQYHPGTLRAMDWHFDNMKIAPTNLLERLKIIGDADVSSGAQEFTAVILELLDLVNQHIPRVDTDPLRGLFLGARGG